MRWMIGVLLLGLVACSAAPPVAQPGSPVPAPSAQAAPGRPAAAAASPVQPTAEPVNDATAIASAPPALSGDQEALAEAWGRDPATLQVTLRTPGAPGEQLPFWITDTQTHTAYQITATLRILSPHLALYVDSSVQLDPALLQSAADTFERTGWPLLSSWYPEHMPQTPITILHTPITGLSGYYAVENLLPPTINPFSNQREMLVLNSAINPAGAGYQATLTHEIQHLVQRRAIAQPTTWLNEGLSMFSEYKLGAGGDGLARQFLLHPDTQLNGWADQPGAALEHYGAADLWLRFVDDHSGGLAVEAAASADGDLDRFVRMMQPRFPQLRTFEDALGAWSVANLLNDPRLEQGLYSYVGLPTTVQPEAGSASDSGTTQQLGSDYLRWPAVPITRTLEWTGSLTVPVIPAPTDGQRIWWSGRGDLRASTLTSSGVVPGDGGSLSYRVWTDLEQDYDYAYLTISSDNGSTWQPIATPLSSADNPAGLNNSQGWTGRRQLWEDVRVDLSAWSGREIMLRFWVVNDQAYHAGGVALDALAVDGVALAWEGAGWQRITNELEQRWRLYGVLDSGSTMIVQALPIENGRVTWTIPPSQTATLVIVATTSLAQEPGSWRSALR